MTEFKIALITLVLIAVYLADNLLAAAMKAPTYFVSIKP